MARRTVTPEQFAAALAEVIGDYADGVYATQEKAVNFATKQALRQVKASSGGFGARYAGDWRSKVEKTNITAHGYVANNRPGLPHLLEKGHAKQNGGRTEGRAHVLPVQEEVNRILQEKLEEGLGQ